MFSQKDEDEKEELKATSHPKEIKKENKILFKKLTNKNQDYFVQLNRRLEELSYDEDKKIVVLNQMISETIDFQEDAITARKMYGTVTDRADKVREIDPEVSEEAKKSSSNNLLYLDGALLLGGMFSIINGFTAWRSIGANADRNLSLIQLIMNFLLGGVIALALVKYRPEPGKTKGMLKYIGVTVGSMMLFLFAMALAEIIIPSAINPEVPSLLAMAIGIIALGLKWYLKKKLDIKGTLI